MRRLVAVMALRPGDRFWSEDPLSDEREILTVVGGPVDHFGSVTVDVAEWDFDFEATTMTYVQLASSRSRGKDP